MTKAKLKEKDLKVLCIASFENERRDHELKNAGQL